MEWMVPDRVDKVGCVPLDRTVIYLTHFNVLQSRVNYTVARFDEDVKNITHQVGRSTLVVKDAKISDRGVYKCVVGSKHLSKEFSNYMIRVMGEFAHKVNRFSTRSIELSQSYRAQLNISKSDGTFESLCSK